MALLIPCVRASLLARFSPETHELLEPRRGRSRQRMTAFVRRLREVNPAARVILTVSPVPLVATAEPRHVLCPLSTRIGLARRFAKF